MLGETTQLLEYFVDRLRILEENFRPYLTQSDEAAGQSLALNFLQLEGIVARQLATLPPLPKPMLPAVADAGPSDDDEWTLEEPTYELKPAAHMRFLESQLQLLRLATMMPEVLPAMLDDAFGRAVAAMAAFQTPALGALRQRLLAARADESLGFTRPELALLFRSVQLCGMAMLLPDFEAMMAMAAATAPTDTKTTAQVRQAMAIIVAGFVELVQREFGSEPEFGQAQREMENLADLL